MNFDFTTEQEMLRSSVQKLMAKHASPEIVRRHDAERSYPYDLYEEWAKAGLLALPFPEEYGGLGGSALDLAIVVEEVSKVSTDLCMMLAGTFFSGLNVLRKGSEAQKRHWLPRLIDGNVRLAIGISEPDAGSDVGAIRTKATRNDAGHWLVNGQKLWTTGAGLKNTTICTYVRTDSTVSYRKGLSMLLIDNDMPGVVTRKLDMLGRRCSGHLRGVLQ